MVMSPDQNAGQSHSIKADNASFQRVKLFTYLGTTVLNQNYIQEEITSKMKSGIYSVLNILSAGLQSKNIKNNVYRTIVLPVVLYGCETRSLTLRGERKLGLSENRVLGRIFGPKRDEVTGEWRKLHNEEPKDLYSSPSIIRVIKSIMRWELHVTRMGKRRVVYWVLVGNSEGKRPLGRLMRRWKNNIKMDRQGIGYGAWVRLIWIRIGIAFF
jgi:hypothetical protein